MAGEYSLSDVMERIFQNQLALEAALPHSCHSLIGAGTGKNKHLENGYQS